MNWRAARCVSETSRRGKLLCDITLYDAGIAQYRSTRCKADVPARAIGVYANKKGKYELSFFGGRTIRTVDVR